MRRLSADDGRKFKEVDVKVEVVDGMYYWTYGVDVWFHWFVGTEYW